MVPRRRNRPAPPPEVDLFRIPVGHRPPVLPPPPANAGLWVVIPHFNPCGFTSRRENIRATLGRLPVPACVAELGFGGRFDMQPGDAAKVLRFEDGDALWQKERLVNLAVRQLPASCHAVAVLDADFLFADPDWHRQAVALLQHFCAVQPFSEWATLERDVALDWAGRRLALPEDPRPSVMAARSRKGVPGGAWVYRRSYLAACGLYDACLVGGGDAVNAGPWVPGLVQPDLFTTGHQTHIRRWGGPAKAATGARAGLVRGAACSIRHGCREKRQLRDRHAILRRHDFDPYRDLARGRDGCWKLKRHGAALGAEILAFLRSRADDEAAVLVPAAPPVPEPVDTEYT